jgi:hypothetical protein
MADMSDSAVLGRNANAVKAFKDFCEEYDRGIDTVVLDPEDRKYMGSDPFEEIHWGDMSVGFFIAQGCTWADAFTLATICRYQYQYWS